MKHRSKVTFRRCINWTIGAFVVMILGTIGTLDIDGCTLKEGLYRIIICCFMIYILCEAKKIPDARSGK